MSSSHSETTVSGRWEVLRAGRNESGGLEIPSIPLPAETEAGPMRLAVGPAGEARLLVPLLAREPVGDIETGGALKIGVTTLIHTQRAIRFLDIVCRSSELDPVFGELVDEVARRVAATKGGVEAVRTVIQDFRALLVPPDRREIKRSRIAGLVAELVVLNRLLGISQSAWRSWCGPAGDRHDFRTRDCSLEVKASLGAHQITINGLDQLEVPSGGSLYLAHFHLEQVEGGLLTVAALGSRALARVNDPAGLRERLAAVGCGDIRDTEWNRFAFRAETERLYRVGPAFPKMAPSTFVDGHVPAGVVDAKYRIDLGFASGCECPPADFDSLLRELCQCP